jgi:DnaJ-class molecular chaperone
MKMKTCPTCNGKGTVPYVLKARSLGPTTFSPTPQVAICNTCKGLGSVDHHHGETK